MENNEKWIEQLIKGDKDTFEQLFVKYKPTLTQFIRKSLPQEEDVEGLVQEIFIKLWLSRTDLRPNTSFNSFIFTIAKNVVIDHLRKLTKTRKKLQELIYNYNLLDNSTQESIEYAELKQLLVNSIDALPPRQKEIFELNRIEGMKYKDIAKQLNISENTVNAHMHQAMLTLKKKLKNYLPFFLISIWF